MLDMGLTRFNLSMAMVCMVNNTAFLSKFTPANVSVFSADDNCQQNSIEIQADYDVSYNWLYFLSYILIIIYNIIILY